MKKNDFLQLIREAQFRELFISEMGWNNWRGAAELPPVTIDDTTYQLSTIAERNGFQILLGEVEQIPTASQCRQIDTRLRRSAHDYIAIFRLRSSEHHLWMAPVRQLEKRDIVIIEYETAEKADFLFSKIDALSFSLDEHTTIVDVKDRIQGAFAVNSEKITKDFYAGFRREHNAFAEFITGIDDEISTKQNRNKQWYTSVMLNRLMFCYFIQKKGFLDGDFDYLANKLRWCQAERGEDRFFGSFYKGFLVHLFSDGLNAPRHEHDFEQTYGHIPYLNGGMFDCHQLERDYQDIDIRDEAFERLFQFFDRWRWHLDTRISASGRDINPDVLGYIFEQYINDRAEMGAYYTKEDITEYIGRSCIVPFLLDRVSHATHEMEQAFAPDGEVWTFLKQSGERYIFPAVKKGFSTDWREQIPEEISRGLIGPNEDETKPISESNIGLIERRLGWNQTTKEPFALPTEIWRETIERLCRCESIIRKISAGEICEPNDFITYNLDIRQFAHDLVEQTTNHHLVAHFYRALQSVTILDPTCGSGAFLFAAMNILEPLYEVCIERMEEFNAANPNLFKDELSELRGRYRSNRQYFIFKSIILRNLYGVDIMQEAVEIAKLRLFLKMVAVVDADRRRPNLGLDPLPDIDFNIRCGNTLVGYATEKEVLQGVAYTDMFAAKEFRADIENEMDRLSHTYDHFRTQQLSDQDDLQQVKAAKAELRQRLAGLNEKLNRQLFAASHHADYNAWLASHQPFHWIAEYYSIIHDHGGFDVVIGNPPYVEYNKKSKETGKAISDLYKLTGYKTIDCGDLYAFCVERSIISLLNKNGAIGMIVPISISSTDGYKSLRSILTSNLKGTYLANFGVRPSKLFDGVDKRLTVFVSSTKEGLHSTKFKRWNTTERLTLFQNINYSSVSADCLGISGIVKVSSPLELSILSKLCNFQVVGCYAQKNSPHFVKYTRKLQYFIQFFIDSPIIYNESGAIVQPSELKYLFFGSDAIRNKAITFLNSSLFFWFFIAFSDCRNVNMREIMHFPTTLDKDDLHDETFKLLSKRMLENLKDNSIFIPRNDKRAGNLKIQSFQPRLSKPIIDEIDKLLALHYGFTEEELDFILNYDIKYRMGDELNKE